jgi:hypothetical protein
VDAFGRLVAEGLQGTEGPEGPEGPPGADGGSFPLPPDPYEGALLGWLDGGLAWVGTPPIPVPPGTFGPITSWNEESGLLTVAGDIPESVGNGVYIYQVDETGAYSTFGCDVSRTWTDFTSGSPHNPNYGWSNVFNYERDNDSNVAFAANNSTMSFFPDLPVKDTLSLYVLNQTDEQTHGCLINDSIWVPGTLAYHTQIDYSASQIGGVLRKLDLKTQSDRGCYLTAIQVDGAWLVNQDESLNMRVNQVLDENIIGVPNTLTAPFEVGKYLSIPAQRVAPWVLYGNDPTSLIDHLRSS